MNSQFPYYRKYLDDSSYFKVISVEEFEEVKRMPGGYRVFKFRARIFPDRRFIDDMIKCLHGYWEAIEGDEYEIVRSKADLSK